MECGHPLELLSWQLCAYDDLLFSDSLSYSGRTLRKVQTHEARDIPEILAGALDSDREFDGKLRNQDRNGTISTKRK